MEQLYKLDTGYLPEDLSNEMEEQEEIQPEAGFIIDSVGKANWAVCKIKEARERRDLFNAAAQGKIEQMERRMKENEERCRQETAYLLSALDRYIDTVPAKETKTQKTFLLPDGKLKKKFPSRALKPDNARLLQYLEGEDCYIKIEKKPAWGEFKKVLKEVNGQVVRTDTGEIVEGVEIEEKPESFDIE